VPSTSFPEVANSVDSERTLLVVLPGTVNYFYNEYGRWIAEAGRELGLRVVVCPLPEVPAATYDLALLGNLAEILHAVGREPGQRLLEDLKRSVGAIVNLSADCARSHWFRNNVELSLALGLNAILDVGFLDQRDVFEAEWSGSGLSYHFAFDGLTEAQARAARPPADPITRTIPWAHVGMQTPERVALTAELVSRVSPRGLVYLPRLSPVTEQGSPHLGPLEMNRILERTRSYVWCSHHASFYMESLRFRTAWLTGCVPVKVVRDDEALPAGLPFADWVVRRSALADDLGGLDFEEARRAFEAEYLRSPWLEDGLADLLNAFGLTSGLGRWRRREEAGDLLPARRCA
jgi:hypothetical protein